MHWVPKDFEPPKKGVNVKDVYLLWNFGNKEKDYIPYCNLHY